MLRKAKLHFRTQVLFCLSVWTLRRGLSFPCPV